MHINRITRTLTDAQIKLLPTTPVTLIPTSPAGYRHKLFGVTLTLTSSAGAYTNVNAVYAELRVEYASGDSACLSLYNDDSLTPDLTDVTLLLASAHTRVIDLLVPLMTVPASAGSQYVSPTMTNTKAGGDTNAVRIKIDNNGSGVLTGGNAANTLKISVYYVAESL